MPKKPENNRNSIGRFVEGSSGNPNGRPLGSKNKFTTLKNTFILIRLAETLVACCVTKCQEESIRLTQI